MLILLRALRNGERDPGLCGWGDANEQSVWGDVFTYSLSWRLPSFHHLLFRFFIYRSVQ